jgi:hypothetical protein
MEASTLKNFSHACVFLDLRVLDGLALEYPVQWYSRTCGGSRLTPKRGQNIMLQAMAEPRAIL